MFNVSMKTKTSFPVNGPRARRLYDAPSVRARDLTAGARQKTDVRELMSLILYFCPRMNNTSENEPNSPEEEVSYYLLKNNEITSFISNKLKDGN